MGMNTIEAIRSIIPAGENSQVEFQPGPGILEKIIRPMLDAGYAEPAFLDQGYEFTIILRKT